MRCFRLSLLVACAAAELGAQRGGRPPRAPAKPATGKSADTTLARKAPDGFVLDFQDQELRVVLFAIAEAGGLNITFANLPPTKTTLRMGQAVTRDQALEILRGVVAANDLKITETPSLILVEGTPPSKVTPQQVAQQQSQAQQLRLYTYRLKHASSVQLAPVLMNLLVGTGAGTGRAGGVTSSGGFFGSNPNPSPGMPSAGGAGRPPPAGAGVRGGNAAAAAVNPLETYQSILRSIGGAGAALSGSSDMRIVAEESTNSLLIRSTANDWELVQQLIGAVDLRPLQVLIEVTIAQVTRTHDLNLGLSGTATQKKSGGGGDTVAILPPVASARDFVYLLTGGKGTVNYNVAINALQTRGDVRVLSLPILIGQNNKEAVLDVGQNVPFVQIQQTSGIDLNGRVQTIQYLPVGKTLTITPTINPDGYVNLAVKQTNNSVSNNVQFNAPIINKQEATTQVFIRDGQTTVFGGLSDNSRDRSTSGIPFLSRIPFIGGLLFGNSKRNETVSELYLFLTPHIVSSDDDVDRLREAVKGQSTLMDGMNVNAKIIPRGDTIRIGDPIRPKAGDAKPRPDSARLRPDSVTKRPEPR